MPKHRIYLDTKFWIVFRDASCGKDSNTSHIDLLNLVRKLRTSGKAICPLSFSSIKELFFQNDLASRRATAAVMDELSGAVCLQPPHVLFDIELWHLMSTALRGTAVASLPEGLVWTKAAYYLGEPEFHSDVIPKEMADVIQKCVDDTIFDNSLGEIVEALSKGPPPPSFDIDRQAMTLTEGKNQHPEKNFSELYRQEIAGGLEAHHGNCCEVILDLCKLSGLEFSVSDTDKDAGGRMVRGLIESAVKDGKVKTTFPQLHITASLHAALRWDDRRCYKRGDCEDFRHAGSALPYCNYFLTEKSLAHLLCNKPLNLDTEYETKVFCDSNTAISALSQLL